LPENRDVFERVASASAQERADALSDFYLPVTPDAGRLLYSLVRAARPATIVEFGMSLGISAIHLASAVRDNGSGRIVTTELSAAKVAAAKKTFANCWPSAAEFAWSKGLTRSRRGSLFGARKMSTPISSS